MKLRFAHTADFTDTGADQSFTLDAVAPLNTTDFHTSKDEVPHAQLANLAAMARSIFHQVGATEGGGHAYADEGTYTVGVTIKDVGGSTASATTNANITDAALTASGTTISGTEGTAISGATVATNGKVVAQNGGGFAVDGKAVSFEGLGFLPGYDYSEAVGVSADGTTVAGNIRPIGGESNGTSQAFFWTGTTGMIGLGYPTGYNISRAFAISGDGSKIVGEGQTTAGGHTPVLFGARQRGLVQFPECRLMRSHSSLAYH